jgi:hypothetical protein
VLRVLVFLCACGALGGSASADDPWEFWPEGQLYVGLNPRTRVFLDAAYAKGKESDDLSLDAAAYLDMSFLPIGPKRRRAYMDEDWQRGRYFWVRVGYDRVFKVTEAEGTPSVAEDRGILSLWGKVPLPGGVWLENRARVDLRWIGGEYSTRYRLRVEATREFNVAGHAVVPQPQRRVVLRHPLRRLGPDPLPGGPRGHREQALPVRDLPGPADGHPPEQVALECLRRGGQGLLLSVALAGRVRIGPLGDDSHAAAFLQNNALLCRLAL